jgi:hypothetical protein
MVIVLLTSIDDSKNRSYFTEHSKQNNKSLTPGWGGQLNMAIVVQGHYPFHIK